METVFYKGYTLKAAPHQLQDSGEWTCRVYICKETGGSTREKPFIASNTFKTQEEANLHSLNFGREVVDGKHEGMELP